MSADERDQNEFKEVDDEAEDEFASADEAGY